MKDSQQQKTKKRLFKKSKDTPKKPGKKPVSLVKNAPKKNQILEKINRNESNLLIFFIPLILLIIYLTIYQINDHVSESVQESKLANSLSGKILPYPVVNKSYIPYISSRAAIVIDSDNQAIIFSKNPNLRFSMASTAKIMSALIALEYYDPKSVLTIKSSRIPGSIIGLRRGEKFYFEDLLYAMLLPSANDAAVAIVDNYPGGKEQFIRKMNEKANDLHMKNTSFSDPTGLDDDGNFTTVDDLAKLGIAAMKSQKLSKAVGTSQKVITNQNKSKQYSLVNLNRLLGTNGVNGIKTGTTEGAGEVLVTSTTQNGHSFIIVVMNSLDRFSDTRSLLSYISQNVSYVDLKYK